MLGDARTKKYVDKRINEGKSNKEIQRYLKRYIARELFPIIVSDLSYFTWCLHRSLNAVVQRFFGSLKHDWLFKIAQPKRLYHFTHLCPLVVIIYLFLVDISLHFIVVIV
jgi:hypothetical protein